MKKIVLLFIIIIMLVTPYISFSKQVTLGGVSIGSIMGIKGLPLLDSISDTYMYGDTITLKYVENGKSVSSLIDLSTMTMYKYTVEFIDHFTVLKFGDTIMEVISSRGGLMEPSPKTFIALINTGGELINGWLLKPALINNLLGIGEYEGKPIVLFGGPNSLLLLELSGTSEISAVNISNISYDDALYYNGNVYIYYESKTIVYSLETNSSSQYDAKLLPSINGVQVFWKNNELIIQYGGRTYVLQNIDEPINAYATLIDDKIVVAYSNSETSQLYIIDPVANTLFTYTIKTSYIEASQAKQYTLFHMGLQDSELQLVYGIGGNMLSNRLVITRIALDDIVTNPLDYYMNSVDYPSSQVKSIAEVKLVETRNVQPTTYSIEPTTIQLNIAIVSPSPSSEYRELTTETISKVEASIRSPKIIVDAPDESMSYGDYELMGIMFNVKVLLPTGIPLGNVETTLIMEIYVDNNYYKNITITDKTDRQGQLLLKITKEEINATGDLTINWILIIDGYKVTGTTNIPYPFPRTTTTTTTTTTIPPPPTEQPTTTTTTTTGATQTTQPGGGTTTTTTTTAPQGGSNILIIAIVVIAVIAAAGFLLYRRR